MNTDDNKIDPAELHNIMKDFSEAFNEVNYADTISKLENKYEGLNIEWIGGAVPVQMNATFNNLRIYARYRGDAFSITMGEDNGPEKLPKADYYIRIAEALNSPWNGFLDAEEFYTLFDQAFTTLLEEYSKNK